MRQTNFSCSDFLRFWEIVFKTADLHNFKLLFPSVMYKKSIKLFGSDNFLQKLSKIEGE